MIALTVPLANFGRLADGTATGAGATHVLDIERMVLAAFLPIPTRTMPHLRLTWIVSPLVAQLIRDFTCLVHFAM